MQLVKNLLGIDKRIVLCLIKQQGQVMENRLDFLGIFPTSCWDEISMVRMGKFDDFFAVFQKKKKGASHRNSYSYYRWIN